MNIVGYVLAGFPNPIGWTIDKVRGFITDAATEGFEALIGGLVAWLTDAVIWVVGGVFNFFIDSADPNVQADWFLADDGPYGTMLGIGAALMVGFLLAGVTQGALSGDVGGMLRRMAVDLPASVLGMVGLVAATQVLIRLTDELSTAVMANFQDDIADFTAVVTSLSRLGGGVASAFVVLLLGLVTVLAGVILVAELTVRGALIYIVVALAPLVFAARLWPALQDTTKKLLYMLAALVLSKLAMAVALSVAAAAAVGAGSGGEVTALPEPEVFAEDPGGSVTQAVGILLSAVAAFGVAAFSPLTVAKLLPLTESAVVAQGIRGMPVRGAQQAASTAYYTQMLSSMRLRRLAHGERPKTPPAPTSAPANVRRRRRHRPARASPPVSSHSVLAPAASHSRQVVEGLGRSDEARSLRVQVARVAAELVGHRRAVPLRVAAEAVRLPARARPVLLPDLPALRQSLVSQRCVGRLRRSGAAVTPSPAGRPTPRMLPTPGRHPALSIRPRRAAAAFRGGWQRGTMAKETLVAVGERTYRLEQLDATGVFLGLGAVQCVLLGGAMVLAVLALTAGIPVLVAATPLFAAGMVSFGRVSGHPLWEWVPLGASWLWTAVTRRRRWTAPLPLWPTDHRQPPRLPPCLAGLEIVDIEWRPGGELAAVRDTERHTMTALIPVPGAQFVVEARADQERLLAGWGEVLSQLAAEQGVVSHISWSHLVRPSRMQRHLEWLADGPLADPSASAALASYGELLDVAANTATVNDVVVSITVARDRLSGRRRVDGDAENRMRQALTGAVDTLLRSLRAAELEPGTPLDSGGLYDLLRTRIDPCGPRPSSTGGRLAERIGLTSASSGPLVVDTNWRSVRVDRAWHRTWWVATWPRLAVPPSWLEPFLSVDAVTRTMTVTLVPVSTYQSRRRIERDLVKLESDATTKEERGRRVDARHQRTTQALLEREQELVAGYAEMSYVGLVSVAAWSEDELEAEAEIVEHLALESGMELRVLDGRQDLAWAAALPLGLAPRGLLAT